MHLPPSVPAASSCPVLTPAIGTFCSNLNYYRTVGGGSVHLPPSFPAAGAAVKQPPAVLPQLLPRHRRAEPHQPQLLGLRARHRRHSSPQKVGEAGISVNK